jgi:hypothetical protein
MSPTENYSPGKIMYDSGTGEVWKTDAEGIRTDLGQLSKNLTTEEARILADKKFPQKWYKDDQLIDTSAFNKQAIPDRTYQIVDPIPDEVDPILVEHEHLIFIRENSDECAEWEIYVSPYLIGHNTTGELLFVVVRTETIGAYSYIDENGKIRGDGTGHSYLVICPADAEATLRADCSKLAHEQGDKWVREANLRDSLKRCTTQ